MTPPPSTFRFSIRLLLAAVAASAAALATLINATEAVLAAVAGGVFLLFLLAALAAVFRRGASGAFAGGFLLSGLAYLALVFVLPADRQSFLAHLPTSRSIDLLHKTVSKAPASEAEMQRWGLPAEIVGTTAGAWFMMQPFPQEKHFHPLGHLYWSLLFGLLGGVLARRFHDLRTGERNAPPRAESA